MTKKMEFIKSTGNVFQDVGFEEQEAKKLQFKSFMMVSLMKYIQVCGLTQIESAKRLAVSQSRISNLMNYRIDVFSTEMLIDMMERAGFSIYEKIEFEITEFLQSNWPNLANSQK